MRKGWNFSEDFTLTDREISVSVWTWRQPPCHDLANAAIVALAICPVGEGFLRDRPTPQLLIEWRAGRPREFLQTYRPRRVANRCDRGGAASAGPMIRAEARAKSLPTRLRIRLRGQEATTPRVGRVC